MSVSINADLDLSDEELVEFGKWICKNKNRIAFLFDGLDQLGCALPACKAGPPPKSKLTSLEWISAILSRSTFTESTVILTSRKFAVTNLEGDIRPHKLLTASGIKATDVKKSLQFHFGEEEGTRLYTKIEKMESPDFVKTPINLYLIGQLLKERVINPDDVTTHNLFMRLSENFQRTRNYPQREDRDVKIGLIEEFCFDLTLEHKFVFSQKDLPRGLMLKDFEQFSMVDAGCLRSSYSSEEDQKVLTFSHQLEQVN